MTKFFDLAATGTTGDLYRTVQKGIEYALMGKSDQFFYNIDAYLNVTPSTKAEYAAQGLEDVKRTIHIADLRAAKLNKKLAKVKPETVNNMTPEYLSIFHVLEHFVSVGVDMNKEGYPTALYTRSYTVLNALVKAGMLPAEDVEKSLQHICGTKTYNSFEAGQFVAARLDVVDVRKGKPQFSLVVPQKAMDIGDSKQFVFIPVPFFYIFERLLDQIAVKRAFTFTKTSVNGQYTHLAATSHDVVREAYAYSDQHALEARLKKIKTGYDVFQQRMQVFDLESSIHSLGLATFRPEMLDVLRPVALRDVDTSRHNIDFSLLRAVYRTRINGGAAPALEKLGYDVSSFATLKDKREALVRYGDDMSDKDLYFYMKARPEFFGEIEQALEKRERNQLKVLKNFEFVDLEKITAGKVLAENAEHTLEAAELLAMAAQGVLRVTIRTKSGRTIERMGTNNTTILSKVLGAGYVQEFETARVKLYALRSALVNKQLGVGTDELSKACVAMEVLDLLDQSRMFPAGQLSEDDKRGSAILELDRAIATLKEKAAARKPNPDEVRLRNVEATDNKDFYFAFNAASVLTVEYSPLPPTPVKKEEASKKTPAKK